MSVAYLRAAVNTVAIRDEPGSVDRIGDFGKGDAVRLVAPVGGALPEWVEVDMVGAVREPAEEGRERPATGFVRTRNRVCALLEPWADGAAAAAAQRPRRRSATLHASWFRSATRTEATAAQHARPLLKGGLEEYEQRQRVHLKARELVEARCRGACPTTSPLKADLANAFGHAPWLEPYVAAEHMVHTLMMVAQVDIDKDRAAAAAQRTATLASAAPPPPSGAAAAAGVKPPASPVELRAPAAPAAAPGGAGRRASGRCRGAQRARVAGPGALAAGGALLGELWARLPPPARGALAATASKTGGSPQLADDHGVLCCDLDVDRDWRAYFRELWTTRRFKWGGSRGAGAFSVGAMSCRGKVLTSKLFLVDLGGSEQVKKSKAEGDRFREAVTINKSLVALGRVVDALVNKNKHHVPYYESKLTTLLQPAFGGNSRPSRARATLARLEAGGAKARALGEAGDARLRGMGAGHAAASRLQAMSHQDDTGGDVSKEAGLSTRQAHAHRGAYSHVDDDAGLYVAESDKLAALLQRKAAIVGAPAK
ncbi:microtubule motor protein [Aureococcus anophagefferens]|uniref:Microtubule motor protein n=1 Tax=Aureococcus anophagefferens TaxID=44056 RepID=A0ABR1FNC7_AURAN